MKRVILLFGIALVLLQPSLLHAQEQGPLAMEIEFQWTAAGAVGGSVIGFALWLTDPGNPHIRLGDQMARGAAIGAILGAVYGLYILQRSALIPARPVVEVEDPLAPGNRITSDPVAAASGFDRPALSSLFGKGGSGISLPVFGFKF